MLEMYADFVLSQKSQVPVQMVPKTKKRAGQKLVYKLRDEHLDAAITEQSLKSQSRVWTRAVKWYIQHCQSLSFLEIIRVKTLQVVGFSPMHDGINQRPSFWSGNQVYIILNGYFRSANGSRSNLSKDFVISQAGG